MNPEGRGLPVLNNGFDPGLHDSAAREFHLQVVSEFIIAHVPLA
jgi:hypothetical protein